MRINIRVCVLISTHYFRGLGLIWSILSGDTTWEPFYNKQQVWVLMPLTLQDSVLLCIKRTMVERKENLSLELYICLIREMTSCQARWTPPPLACWTCLCRNDDLPRSLTERRDMSRSMRSLVEKGWEKKYIFMCPPVTNGGWQCNWRSPVRLTAHA